MAAQSVEEMQRRQQQRLAEMAAKEEEGKKTSSLRDQIDGKIAAVHEQQLTTVSCGV